MVPFLKRRELDGAPFILPSSHALFGELNAVINGISDDMHHRIGNIFDDELVQFGISTEHLQFYFLSLRPGDFPDNTGHFIEKLPHRNHPDFHDPFLQLVQLSLKTFGRLGQFKCAI